jgi:predicted Fe-Mo cluster-binding NifX family protein
MKIAIPTAQGKLSLHFGHCEKFTIIEVDKDNKIIKNTTTLDSPPHEPGLLPKWLGEKNVNMIIAGGMGQRAQALFNNQNIQVIVGAPADTPENIVKLYMNNSLVCGNNACDH